MNLSPNTLTAIATVILGMIYLYRCDDPRAWDWVKAKLTGMFAKRPSGDAS